MSSVTPGVVLVPVDTQPPHAGAPIGQRLRTQAQRLAVQDVVFVQAADPAALTAGGDVGAGHDAVVLREGADEGPLVILVGHVVRPGQTDPRGPTGVEGWRDKNTRKYQPGGNAKHQTTTAAAGRSSGRAGNPTEHRRYLY